MLETVFRSITHRVADAAHHYPLAAAVIVQCLNQIAGDYLEFGVFQGDTLVQTYRNIAAAAHYFENNLASAIDTRELRKTRLFGFDSFEGMPAATGPDRAAGFSKGVLACSEEEVRKRLRKKRVNMSTVELVKGFYQDTLTAETKARLGLRVASIVHIDCDYYESARLVLEFITDLLVDGSIIVFDDWWLFKGHPDRGEQRAFSEWVAKYGIRASEFVKTTANSFIIHK
jgi:O-methyltransferase